MGFDCCDKRGPKIRSIFVRGKIIGIQGLDDVCSVVKNRNFSSREEIKREMLKKVKEKNFVPSEVEWEYGEALLNEYERYKRGK